MRHRRGGMSPWAVALIGAAVVIGVVAVAKNFPQLRRYIRMERM